MANPGVLHGAEPFRNACVCIGAGWCGAGVLGGPLPSIPEEASRLVCQLGLRGDDRDRTRVTLNISPLSRMRMGLCVASGPRRGCVLGWRSLSRFLLLLGRGEAHSFQTAASSPPPGGQLYPMNGRWPRAWRGLAKIRLSLWVCPVAAKNKWM